MIDNKNQDDKSKEFTCNDSAEDIAKNNLEFDNDKDDSMMADTSNNKTELRPRAIFVFGRWLLAGVIWVILWILISAELNTAIVTADSLSADAKYLIFYLSFPFVSSLISLIVAYMLFRHNHAMWDSTLFYTFIFGGVFYYISTTSAYFELSEKFTNDLIFNIYCMGCFVVLNIFLPVLLKPKKS